MIRQKSKNGRVLERKPTSSGSNPAGSKHKNAPQGNRPKGNFSMAGQPGTHQSVLKNTWQIALAGGVLLLVFLWTFWTTFSSLTVVWNRDADYSHGWFVMPLAACFLWQRRDTFPGFSSQLPFAGLILVCASGAMDIAGSLWYFEPIRAWSIPLWIAGVCWFFGGRKLLSWSLPAVVFLGFMIPLPYRVETFLSWPLQRVATELSCWMLQSFGQPAIAEGNVIAIDNLHLAVAEACSGLRIFVSIIALAFAFVVLTKKPWWTKACLCLSVVPVTLIANATRIAVTGLLNVYVSGEAAHRFSHDVAGWLMIVFAGALLAAVLSYVGRLFIEVETISVRELLSNDKASG
jgi:exosortase